MRRLYVGFGAVLAAIVAAVVLLAGNTQTTSGVSGGRERGALDKRWLACILGPTGGPLGPRISPSVVPPALGSSEGSDSYEAFGRDSCQVR